MTLGGGFMAAMDEFRKEREAIKNGTLKQKLSYFWDYYKWYVIIPLIIIIAVGSTIYHKLTDPETILNGVLLNCYNMEKQDATLEFMESFYEAHDIDTKEYKADFNCRIVQISDLHNQLFGKEQERLIDEAAHSAILTAGAGSSRIN